jgi:spectrin beta
MEALTRRHTWHPSSSSPENPEDISVQKIRALTDEREAVQKRTFTNWVNSHVGVSSKDGKSSFIVEDLYRDCADGHVLAKLVETLSGDTMPRISRGKMRIHHLENVDKVLEYLRNHNCQLENVHAHDIVDGNPKIVLGLFWKLILKYQLTTLKPIEGKELNKVSIVVIKKSLLLWCQSAIQKYPNVSVSDFTLSWKDGRAFCALVHKHRPDLIDYEAMARASPIERLSTAFTVARDQLNVPSLLEPEDLLGFQDEKSIMIYLATLHQVGIA